MNKIIGIGNALVDVLIKLDNDKFLSDHKLPKGSMQLVEKDVANQLLGAIKHVTPQLASGGSAANTIHGLAKLGAETAFVGKIGNDEFGRIFFGDLKDNRIEPILLQSSNETGRALTFISPDSERTFATFLGAAAEISDNDLDECQYAGFDLLHIEGYLVFNEALVEKAAQLAKKCGLKISIDLASFNVVDIKREFLLKTIEKYVDIVFANEEEAKSLTGQEPEQALETISKICEIAVVKIGSKGSMVKRGNEIPKVTAIKASAVDTTGAGDLYASGFLYGLTQNWTLDKCARLGSLTAGKVVETIGAKITFEGWDEIHSKLNSI